MLLRPPSPPPFPYTTLFRSDPEGLVRLAATAGYEADLSWARHGPEGAYDVLFTRAGPRTPERVPFPADRKSTRLNSSHTVISYAVFCLKKKKTRTRQRTNSH